MEAVMKRQMFLSEKVKTHDLVKVCIVASPASQVFLAIVEKVYSSDSGIFSQCTGEKIEFVGSPGHWGCVSLAVGDRALVFLKSIFGRLYEDPWCGHMTIDEIDGLDYASFPAKELWLRDDFPASLGAGSRQDPKRSYATAIRLDVMESYLVDRIYEKPIRG